MQELLGQARLPRPPRAGPEHALWAVRRRAKAAGLGRNLHGLGQRLRTSPRSAGDEHTCHVNVHQRCSVCMCAVNGGPHCRGSLRRRVSWVSCKLLPGCAQALTLSVRARAAQARASGDSALIEQASWATSTIMALGR